MKRRSLKTCLTALMTLGATGLLTGCKTVVLFPAGDIASRQADLLMASVWLMLLIIIPVMGLVVFFAWKYRASNKDDARYEPDWDHSTKLELAIWAAPLLIIIALGAMTWVGTHLLDPYRPLSRLSADKALEKVEPLEVDVVALDWKWLFIYPEQGIAAVNQLVLPTDRPIHFRLTSSTVMNAFYVPAMAGMIYAMPGMETKLHAVINRDGEYQGFSANYSGAGFSGMRFKVHSFPQAEFEKWAEATKQNTEFLDGPAYLNLERPSENEPPRVYGKVDPDLYRKVVNLCVAPGKMCMGDMMAIDLRGGLGLAGLMVSEATKYSQDKEQMAKDHAKMRYDFASLCTGNPSLELSRDPYKNIPDMTPLKGHNLIAPVFKQEAK